MQENIKTSRKVKKGIVVSNKMQKLLWSKWIEHLVIHNMAKLSHDLKKFYAHHESETPLQIGDTVKIVETRPLSKLKRWRVVEE